MSSWKVDISSDDMMRKIQAMTEQEIAKIGLNHLTIFRPRWITNAYSEHYHKFNGMMAINSFIISMYPLTGSISCEMLARCIFHHATETLELDPTNRNKPVQILNNL